MRPALTLSLSSDWFILVAMITRSSVSMVIAQGSAVVARDFMLLWRRLYVSRSVEPSDERDVRNFAMASCS